MSTFKSVAIRSEMHRSMYNAAIIKSLTRLLVIVAPRMPRVRISRSYYIIGIEFSIANETIIKCLSSVLYKRLNYRGNFS